MSDFNAILLADDDADFVLLLELALEHVGMAGRLKVVTDGTEAMEYLTSLVREENYGKVPLPRLVLLDLRLPRVGGFEVVRWIKSQPKLQHLPVVILTGSDIEHEHSQAAKLGVDAFLIKPLTFDKLVHLVEHIRSVWLPESFPRQSEAA